MSDFERNNAHGGRFNPSRDQIRAERLVDEVEAFNRAHAVGSAFRYLSSPRATPLVVRTNSAAWVLSGHTAVVMVDEVAGCVALSALSPFDGVP